VRIANLKAEIFKPIIDTRYDVVKLVSHDENKISSTPVHNSLEIIQLSKHVDVVGIDEA
jgi:thymidine kinase